MLKRANAVIANKDELEVDGILSPGEFTTRGAARLLNELLRSTKEPQSSAAPGGPAPSHPRHASALQRDERRVDDSSR